MFCAFFSQSLSRKQCAQNLDEIKKWRERNTDNLCRLWFFFFFGCVFLLLRGKAFDLMVCSPCRFCPFACEPIYNDARMTVKSKTHKNWMFNISLRWKSATWCWTCSFFFTFCFLRYIYIHILLISFLSKSAYPMHVPHYLQTQSRYIIIIMFRSQSLVGVFFLCMFTLLNAHVSAI